MGSCTTSRLYKVCGGGAGWWVGTPRFSTLSPAEVTWQPTVLFIPPDLILLMNNREELCCPREWISATGRISGRFVRRCLLMQGAFETVHK